MAEIPAELKRRDVDSEAEEIDKKPDGIARVFEWAGKPLLPFSSERHCAFQRLGVFAPDTSSRTSPIEAAAVTIRLCQLTPAEVSRIRGGGIQKFHEELAVWMEERNIGFGNKDGRSERTAKAIDLYNEIWDDLFRRHWNQNRCTYTAGKRITPGDQALYVATVLRATHGALTPFQVAWELAFADGIRLDLAGAMFEGVKLKRR